MESYRFNSDSPAAQVAAVMRVLQCNMRSAKDTRGAIVDQRADKVSASDLGRLLYHEVIVAGTQSAKGGQLGDLHHYKD